jgi:hypothetical protein
MRRLVLALAATLLLVAGLATPPAGADVDSATESPGFDFGNGAALVLAPFNGQTLQVRWGNVSRSFTTTRTEIPITGNFLPGGGTDVLLYTPGTGADRLLRFSRSGTTITMASSSLAINGTYQPLVGDFDGNGMDDIFWYGVGGAPDSLWLFKSAGGYVIKPVSVRGTYRPFVFDSSGDGYDDIFWYGPGTNPDAIWEFGVGGGHTNRPMSVNGNYTPILGHFIETAEGTPQRQILWFNPAGPDTMWAFASNGDILGRSFTNIDGNYQPIVGWFTTPYRDSVLFYRPGTASEQLLAFSASGAEQHLEAPVVNGVYAPVVGDFSADQDGYQDIAWVANGAGTIWRFNGGGYSTTSFNSGLPNTNPISTPIT